MHESGHSMSSIPQVFVNLRTYLHPYPVDKENAVERMDWLTPTDTPLLKDIHTAVVAIAAPQRNTASFVPLIVS